VFGPVWTVLYGLIGYGLGLSLSSARPDDVSEDAPRDLFVLLALNIAWSPLFLRRYVAEALALLLAMIVQSVWVINRSPGLRPFVGPYALWLCYAAYLNSVYVVRLR
jgi:benzodiazapine receptor